MSLEDEIRRMGDARAAEIRVSSWRNRNPRRSRRVWFAAAAAALVLVVGVAGAGLLDGDDAPNVDTDDTETVRTATTTTAIPDTTTTTTTTVASNPTVATPQPRGVCAANLPPDEEILDLATHIAFDQTPLDLDQDGIDDEMLVYDDEEGWHLLVRLQTGWTNPVALGQPVIPTLTNNPAGIPAAADIDGDGGLEFFVDGYGNTARSSALISLSDCTLRRAAFDGEPDDPISMGLVLHGVGGGSCRPTGCHPRVRCADELLFLEIVEPTDAWRGTNDETAPGLEMVWTTTAYTLVDGRLTEQETTTRTFPWSDPIADAPTAADSDFVDCSP